MSAVFDQFFENQLDIEVKRRYDDYTPIKMNRDVAERMSFDELLQRMDKVKPLDEHAHAKTRIYNHIFLEKLKTLRASKAVQKEALDATSFYDSMLLDKHVRSKQYERLRDIAQQFEPKAGAKKNFILKLFS